MALQDEPVTPSVPVFLRPEFNTHIFIALILDNAIDVDALKSTIAASPITQLPRFCSVLLFDQKTGKVKAWRKLPHLDIDQHFVVVTETLSSGTNDTEGSVLNQYLADLAMNRTLGTEKPLWEIHVLLAHRCIVFWVHHAIGDGASLMSLLQTSFCKNNSVTCRSKRNERRWRSFGFWWFSAKFITEYFWKILFTNGDRKTDIFGGPGSELRPKKLATATFSIDDMKFIKFAVHDATINDVLITITSAGIGRYLGYRSGSTVGLQITCICTTNLRGKTGLWDMSDMNSEWGNKSSGYLVPIHCHEAATNPLEYLKSVSVTLQRRKCSSKVRFLKRLASFSHSLDGGKSTAKLGYKMFSKTTLTLSNMVGPKEEMEVAGNRVKDLRSGVSGAPQSLVMHMVSYQGKANLQIVVVEDIIPDPDFLAKCFEDVMLELKQLASVARDFSN